MPLLLESVRTYLISSGAISSGWSCYISAAPDDANQIVVLEFTGGFPQDTHAGENLRPTFQVRVRGDRMNYSTVESKWYDIWKKLHNTSSISGVRMMLAVQTAPIVLHDEKGRLNMLVNFNAVIAAP